MLSFDPRRAPLRSLAGAAILAAPLAASTAVGQVEKVGDEFQVNTTTYSYQTTEGRRNVGVADDGSFVVVWQSDYQDGYGPGIAARRFDSNGNPLGDDFIVNTTTTAFQGDPSLAMQPDGSFTIIWTDDDYIAGKVNGQSFDATGAATSSEFQADTPMTAFASYPCAAPSENGDFVMVWSGLPQSSLLPDVFVRRVTSTGSGVGSQSVTHGNTSGDQEFPFVDTNSEGDFLAVWSDENRIGARFYNADGTPVGEDFSANQSDGSTRNRPAAMLRDDGTSVIVWTSDTIDGDSRGVAGQRFDSDGNAVGAAFVVNQFTTGYQEYPAIEELPNGHFVVVWESNNVDGDLSGIALRAFDSDATPVGDEIVVNTYTSSRQARPHVAANASGDITVVWSSQFQEGDDDGDGVFGQRLSFTSDSAGNCATPVTGGTTPLASDCLFLLQVAVALDTCSPECLCAPTGSLPTSATDALLCLNVAVGNPGELNCPC